MKPNHIITFSEFLKIAETNSNLIIPEEQSTMDRDEFGVIFGRFFVPVQFSDGVSNILRNRNKLAMEDTMTDVENSLYYDERYSQWGNGVMAGMARLKEALEANEQ